MATLFEKITSDPTTLAANMVSHAHNSIIAWAKTRGIKAEFSMADYLHDLQKMEACLTKEPKITGAIKVEVVEREATP